MHPTCVTISLFYEFQDFFLCTELGFTHPAVADVLTLAPGTASSCILYCPLSCYMRLLCRMHMLLWACSHGNFLLSGLGVPYRASKLTLICTTSSGEATTRVTTQFVWQRLNPCLEAVKLQHISAPLKDRLGQRWRQTNVAGMKDRETKQQTEKLLKWNWFVSSLTQLKKKQFSCRLTTRCKQKLWWPRLEIQTGWRKGKADT